MAVCQSTLPPMAPTMREIEEHPATVEYSDGRVAVVADNSSLNEILRDVARRAGMAVNGSVIEERVFGTYGPAAPAEVLTALLKGTDNNMMVVAGSSHALQLILTPKHGGPTPPNPRAAEDRAEADARFAQSRAAELEGALAGARLEKTAGAEDKAAATDENDKNIRTKEADQTGDAPVVEHAAESPEAPATPK